MHFRFRYITRGDQTQQCRLLLTKLLLHDMKKKQQNIQPVRLLTHDLTHNNNPSHENADQYTGLKPRHTHTHTHTHTPWGEKTH